MKRQGPQKPTTAKAGLVIRAASGAPLSRTQVEFNRLMKSLEAIKLRHHSEQQRLDETLITAIRELMPLVEELNQLNRDLVISGAKAFHALKLTARRRQALGDLLSLKARELLDDPVGLTDKEITQLTEIADTLNPTPFHSNGAPGEKQDLSREIQMMEQAARNAGLDYDLSDLDPQGDVEEFQRIANERLRAAFAKKAAAATTEAPPKRKLTKAQAENELKRLAAEEAKNRDLKTLFKQLAKAFHPDLEPDPLLKEHKQVWMQRLNAAYAADDLREMLQLEMEWLGEEATNLASAGDQKLQVYCMVLKQQISDLKQQTHQLPYQPQYRTLLRFRNRHHGTIARTVTIKRDLLGQLDHCEGMLEILTANNPASRRLLYDWADAHADRIEDSF